MSQFDNLSPAFRRSILRLANKKTEAKAQDVEKTIRTAHAYVDKVIGPWLAKLSSSEVNEVERVLSEINGLDNEEIEKAMPNPFAIPIEMERDGGIGIIDVG